MSIKNSNDFIVGCACAIGCEIFYGLSFIFTKQAMESASQSALLGWRFFIAFVVMSLLAATGTVKINIKGKALRPLMLISLFYPCIYFIGETNGIRLTTASESGVLISCIPIASLTASALILKKKPSLAQVTGILITLAGVLVTIFVVGVSSSFSLTGYAFLILAVVSYALYSVFVDKASDYSGAEITYSMLMAGAALFVTIAAAEALNGGTFKELLMLPLRSKWFLTAILYQGIGCSVLAFFMGNVAIANIGVNRTASFVGLATLFAVISGFLVLKEPFTIWQAVGAALIVAGVYIANMKKRGGKSA